MPTQVDAYPEGGGASFGTTNFDVAREIAWLEDLTA
jgi:hypothetical protein